MKCSRSQFTLLSFCLLLVLKVEASEPLNEASLSDGISSLPDDMMSFLYDGAVLPVYIASSEATQSDNLASTVDIAEAEIGLLEDKVYLNKVTFTDKSKRSYISKSVQNLIDSAAGKPFDKTGVLALGKHARIELDFYTMRLQLVLDSEGFGVYRNNMDEKTKFIPKSSSSSLTGVINYDLNLSKSYGETASSSNNFSIDSVFSYAENHLNVAGAYYGNNGSGELSLDKFLVERDFEGMRLSAGMLDGWSMQSLSNISTMGSERLYGLSFGNDSRSSLNDDDGRSITPLEVYLPTPGEVKVYRDARLISVQQLTVGRHELDTKNFPKGIYDVNVEIVSGGKTIEKKTLRVNKSSGANTQELKWQVFSGVTQKKTAYWDSGDCSEDTSNWMDMGTTDCDKNQSSDDTDTSRHFLVGAGLSFSKWGWNYDGSLYLKKDTLVNENWLNWKPVESLQVDLQSIVTSKHEHDLVGTVTTFLPNGIGSVWATREKGNEFDAKRIDYSSRDYFSVGGSVNLQSFLPENSSLSLGNINFTHEVDNTQNTKLNRADYNQTIYNNMLGSVDFQLGVSNEQYFDSDSEMKQFYANVNFSIPLGVDFDIGYSKQGDEDSMSLAVGKEFDGPISYANFSANKYLNGDKQLLHNSYVNYDTKYNSGTFSLSGGDGSTNVSLNSQGALSLGQTGLSFGNGDAEAGIVIALPDNVGDNDLEAEVGGEVYPLAHGNTLLPVSAYNTYDVNVRVSGSAEDSYDLSIDDDSYTVYPGNVVDVIPVVKKMVTVFGRLIDNSGQAIANANIKNHIGYTVTDNNGYFSIDVDKEHPVLKVDSDSTGEFEVNMSFENVSSAQAMGTIKWEGPFMTSYSLSLQPNDGEVG
ncbi:CS1-pili formation C-terminal domain-containing protein [Aeromonas enteropelogenes]|uniref:CS1-pili formation C-terminal domain-containing protein n=1 Tax=Aeromonas enteropelogenes TaxID=29489 RepID=UPI003BA221E8